TMNALDATLDGPGDAFVVELTAGGASLAFATFLGGSGYDSAAAIAVDGAGRVHVAGSTSSTDFPIVAATAPQPVFGGGEGDGFAAAIDGATGALVYATYLGGAGVDFAGALALGPAGDAFVAGATHSDDFP